MPKPTTAPKSLPMRKRRAALRSRLRALQATLTIEAGGDTEWLTDDVRAHLKTLRRLADGVAD